MALDYGQIADRNAKQDPQFLKQGQAYAGQLLNTYRAELPQTYQEQTGLFTGAVPQLAGAANSAASAEQAQRLQFLKPAQRDINSTVRYQTDLLHGAQSAGEPLMGQLYGEAGNSGPSQLSQMLGAQAVNELQQGRGLSPAEARLADQGARSAWSDRGLAYTGPAAIDEVLNREQFARDRERERQQFASGVNSQLLGEQQQNRAFQQGVLGEGVQRSASFGNQAAQDVASRLAIDPRRTILGLQSNVPMLYGAAANTLSGASGSQQNALNLGDAYSGLLINRQGALDIANMNNQAALQAAKMSADATNDAATKALWGSVIQSVGSAVGGAAGACWVAREVYGEENPRWQEFRAWLLTMAKPRRFASYLRHGPRIAAWLQTRPRWKHFVRRWMDKCIEQYTHTV